MGLRNKLASSFLVLFALVFIPVNWAEASAGGSDLTELKDLPAAPTWGDCAGIDNKGACNCYREGQSCTHESECCDRCIKVPGKRSGADVCGNDYFTKNSYCLGATTHRLIPDVGQKFACLGSTPTSPKVCTAVADIECQQSDVEYCKYQKATVGISQEGYSVGGIGSCCLKGTYCVPPMEKASEELPVGYRDIVARDGGCSPCSEGQIFCANEEMKCDCDKDGDGQKDSTDCPTRDDNQDFYQLGKGGYIPLSDAAQKAGFVGHCIIPSQKGPKAPGGSIAGRILSFSAIPYEPIVIQIGECCDTAQAAVLVASAPPEYVIFGSPLGFMPFKEFKENAAQGRVVKTFTVADCGRKIRNQHDPEG